MNKAILFGAGAAVLAFMFFRMKDVDTKPEELEFINYEDLPRKRGAVGLGLQGPGE